MFELSAYSALLLIAVGVIIFFLPHIVARWIALPMALLLVLLFCNNIVLAHTLTELPPTAWLSRPLNWFQGIGLTWQFRIGSFNLVFLLLITGIGALIFLYAQFYMQGYKKLNAFYAYLTLFSGAMLGIVSADNLLLLFVFWELTSISSYLLIGFQHEKDAAREAARQGLFVTVAGGLALLIAIISIQAVAHTLSLQVLLAEPMRLTTSPWLGWITLLIIIGAITKSAQFPFHFWLPGAMQAPTPVSAFLHSATMVNAGVFLLAVFHPLLCQIFFWYPLLSVIGLLTMATGALLAINQTDIKLILAYTTVFALGSMIYMLAGDSPAVLHAMVIFIVVHALYKAALFMLAGYLDKAYGSRELSRLGGLTKQSLLALFILLVSCGSMAAIPPFFGFFAKQLAFAAKLAKPDISWLMEGLSFLTAAIIAWQAIRLVVYLVKSPATPLRTLPYTRLLFPPLCLSLITLLLGLFPEKHWASTLINLSAAMISGTHAFARPPAEGLTLTSPLLTSAIFILGFLLFLGNRYGIALANHCRFLLYIGPQYLFTQLLHGVPIVSSQVTRFFQNGNLVHYIRWIWLVFFLSLAITVVAVFPHLAFHVQTQPFYLADIGLALLAFFSALAAVSLRSAVSVLALLGVLGLVMALIFLIHGAPDVAITQILVEILIVIFFVFNLHRLPTIAIVPQKRHLVPRLFQIILAIGVGVVVTFLCLCVLSYPLPHNISRWYLENSYALGKGKNVVNVILVDFRAIDTLGEILVVLAAAIGVLGLILKHSRSGAEDA